MVNQMSSCRPAVGDQFALSRIIDSLPYPTYEVTKQILGTTKPLTRDVLISHLSMRYIALRTQWKAEGEKRKGDEQAYFAGEGNGGGKVRKA